MAKELEDNGVEEILYKVFVGNPTKKLLDVIKTDDISLVVMGSQGQGMIEDLFLGSTSHNIARHSETSVLLVPRV